MCTKNCDERQLCSWDRQQAYYGLRVRGNNVLVEQWNFTQPSAKLQPNLLNMCSKNRNKRQLNGWDPVPSRDTSGVHTDGLSGRRCHTRFTWHRSCFTWYWLFLWLKKVLRSQENFIANRGRKDLRLRLWNLVS